MPLRVKLGLAVAGASVVALVLVLIAVALHISALAGGAGLAVVVVAVVYEIFVYYPKFDFTGTTRWRGPRHRKRVALTFDDGPTPFTGAILDVLAAKQAPATFFFLGENAKRHPELVTRARADGHAIGNHGASHRKMHRLTRCEIEGEIKLTELLLGDITRLNGRKILRVPHGFKSLALTRVARTLGYVLVGWTAGVWDSDRPGADVIVERAAAALAPGCILLLHDGDGVSAAVDRSQTAQALPAIIDSARQRGFEFVSLAELIEG